MLSQGCFLGQEGVRETAKPDETGGDAKGQRFVSVDYTESSSPNLLGQQNEKADPFLGGTDSDGTTKPTKRKQGKQPKRCLSLEGAQGPGVGGGREAEGTEPRTLS